MIKNRGECSTICFPKTSIGPILAQNWDWLKPLEELVVLMRIQFKVKVCVQRSGGCILILISFHRINQIDQL